MTLFAERFPKNFFLQNIFNVVHEISKEEIFLG